MDRKQRKELGLLPRQLIGTIQDLIAEGEIARGMSRETATLIVMGELSTDPQYTAAYATVGEPDWEQIKIIVEMILTFLMLFM